MSTIATDSDLQLLARYARDRAEDAFAEIVRRHVDLVHSAALRQVRSPQLAEEVAQSVFTDLARSAAKLVSSTGITPVLTAWLYQVTRRTAIDVVRREARRQLREQIATEMNAMNATAADWTRIEPLLDEAMSALDEADRAAILLRYFENKSLREVGTTLGTSDDAAQKRVSRAIERLREFFAKRGITVGASGLTLVISANAVQAAPVGLAVTISTAAAFAGTTITTTASATATQAITMTTLQKALLAVTVGAACVGTPVLIQQQTQVKLREENVALRQQIEQLTPLTAENERLSNLVASAKPALSKEQLNDLVRLRSEVGVLRRQTNEMGKLLDHRQSLEMAATSAVAGLEVVENETALSQALLTKAKDDIQSSLSKRSAKNKNELIGNFTSDFKDSTLFKISGFSEMPGSEKVTLFLYFDQVQELRGVELESIAGEWKVSGETRALRERQ